MILSQRFAASCTQWRATCYTPVLLSQSDTLTDLTPYTM